MKKHGGMMRKAGRTAVAVAMGSLLGVPLAMAQDAGVAMKDSTPQPLALSGQKDNNFGPLSVNVVVEGMNDVQTHSKVKFKIENDGDVPVVPRVEIYSKDNDTIPVGLATFSDSLLPGLPPVLMPGDEAEATWEAGDDGEYTVKVTDLFGLAWNQSDFKVR
jgi:hypothetical protein